MNKIDGESILERQDNRQRARHAKRMKRYRQRKILVLILAVLVVAVAGFAILYQAKQSPIKLNGDAEMTISLNGVYDEPGATAKTTVKRSRSTVIWIRRKPENIR